MFVKACLEDLAFTPEHAIECHGASIEHAHGWDGEASDASGRTPFRQVDIISKKIGAFFQVNKGPDGLLSTLLVKKHV